MFIFAVLAFYLFQISYLACLLLCTKTPKQIPCTVCMFLLSYKPDSDSNSDSEKFSLFRQICWYLLDGFTETFVDIQCSQTMYSCDIFYFQLAVLAFYVLHIFYLICLLLCTKTPKQLPSTVCMFLPSNKPDSDSEKFSLFRQICWYLLDGFTDTFVDIQCSQMMYSYDFGVPRNFHLVPAGWHFWFRVKCLRNYGMD